jgi:EAL domain-containing protein (putative c-di-GMP-specific phosphodiesterase class I)
MVSICKDLRVELVAQGVETAAERAALLDLGCVIQQGVLYTRAGRAPRG